MIFKVIQGLKIIIKIFFYVSWKETLIYLRNSLTKPKIKLVKNNNLYKYMVEKDTLAKNFHEPHFKEIVKLLIKKGNHCLDLGAYIGVHSIIMSKKAKNGHVYSFEPDSLLFSLMQLNLIKNKVKNIKTYKLAVLNKTADCVNLSDFNYNANNLNLGVRIVENKKKYNSGNLSASIKIDELKLPKIDFVKIDIQGSEYLALQGMKKIINSDRPNFFIEIEEFYLNKMNTSKIELINFFKKKNYLLFQIKTKYPVDYLCVPKEKFNYFKENLKKFSYSLKRV